MHYFIKISIASKNKQNHAEQYSLYTFSQKINEKKIQSLWNSTAFLPVQHFWTYNVQSITHALKGVPSRRLCQSRNF